MPDSKIMTSKKYIRFVVRIPREYVTIDKNILGGQPVLRGTRIPLNVIDEYLSKGWRVNELVQPFPDIDINLVENLLRYRSSFSEEYGSEEKRK